MFKSTALLLLAFFLVVGLWPARAATPDSKASFESNCAACHGPDGKGNEKMKALVKDDMSKLNLVDEETSKKSDPQLTGTIRDGVPKSLMRGFKDKFSDQEIGGLVEHIRSLQKK